jgi:hypothetical protein
MRFYATFDISDTGPLEINLDPRIQHPGVGAIEVLSVTENVITMDVELLKGVDPQQVCEDAEFDFDGYELIEVGYY